jgi:hypothetical protein
MAQNLFSCLSRYSSTAVENYLTEALVYVLRLLLQRAPHDGLRIVNELTGSHEAPLFSDPSSVCILTQVSTDEGRPDIEISDGISVRVYVEVKHDSPLGQDQLERYRSQLLASGVPSTQLVLLARSRTAALATTVTAEEFVCRTWYDVYNWLSAVRTEDGVSRFLTEHLMSFLEEKSMSMKRVGWEYEEGIAALMNLNDMLKAAIEVALPDPKLLITAGRSWMGYYLPNDYFVGVRYDNPMILVCEDERGYPQAKYKRGLDFGASRFFCLSKDEQFETLVEFVRTAAGGTEGQE